METRPACPGCQAPDSILLRIVRRRSADREQIRECRHCGHVWRILDPRPDLRQTADRPDRPEPKAGIRDKVLRRLAAMVGPTEIAAELVGQVDEHLVRVVVADLADRELNPPEPDSSELLPLI